MGCDDNVQNFDIEHFEIICFVFWYRNLYRRVVFRFSDRLKKFYQNNWAFFRWFYKCHMKLLCFIHSNWCCWSFKQMWMKRLNKIIYHSLLLFKKKMRAKKKQKKCEPKMISEEAVKCEWYSDDRQNVRKIDITHCNKRRKKKERISTAYEKEAFRSWNIRNLWPTHEVQRWSNRTYK